MLCNLARRAGYFATAIALPWIIGTAAAPAAHAEETYNVVAIVQLPAGPHACGGAPCQPLASTDIAWVDGDSHTYALTDRSNKSIDIIDTRKNEKIRPLTADPPFAGVSLVSGAGGGPQGVVIVEHKEVWAGDGPHCTGATVNTCDKSGSFKVIDLETGKTIKTIYVNNPNSGVLVNGKHINGGVDEICYNPSSDVIVGASHAKPFKDQFLTFVGEDKEGNKAILETMTLDGSDPNAQNFDAGGNGIEQCQATRDGKFWLVVPKAANGYGAVLRISGKAPFKVEQVFSITAAGCSPPLGGPAGLAIGPDHQMLVGCNGTSNQSLIIDDRSSTTLLPPRYVPTASGVDQVWFDPGSKHYYLAQSAAVPAIMGVEDAFGKQPHDPNASTATGSKNPAADPDRNLVYLPVLAVPTGTSICGSTQDVDGNLGNPQQGCIAIYSTAPLDKDDRHHDRDDH
jgi:hypothetical protein